MKKSSILLVLVLFITTLTTFGQDTKKVKIDHENPWFTEVYFVLTKDNNIKHGNYRKFAYGNCLVTNGYYKNNLKDSLWTEYFLKKKIVQSQGYYLNDQKTGIWLEYYLVGKKNTLKSKGEYIDGVKNGIWEFYEQNSELVQKYDFDNNKLLYFKPDPNDIEYEIETENGIIKTKLDRPPLYIGGNDETMEILGTELTYPDIAKETGISGTVLISFFIDTNGVTQDYQVEKGIGGGCDEEALRVVKLLSDNWLPGCLNGKLVKTKYLCPISFSLN